MATGYFAHVVRGQSGPLPAGFALLRGSLVSSLPKRYLNDPLLNGVADEFSAGFDLEDLHHAIFVRSDGSHGDVQQVRYFLHRAPFCQ